jgi:hypothetical protein
MNYKEDYSSFLASYKSGFVSAENVGKVICDFTQYFIDSNTNYCMKEIVFNRVLAGIEQAELEGKQLSSAKAKVIAESRDEFADFIKSKRDVENIEQILKSLMSLQRGIQQEFNHVTI